MLAQVLKLRTLVVPILLCAFVVALTSCATQQQNTALVQDPDDHHDSSIPWNKQETWEKGQQFQGMTDRR